MCGCWYKCMCGCGVCVSVGACANLMFLLLRRIAITARTCISICAYMPYTRALTYTHPQPYLSPTHTHTHTHTFLEYRFMFGKNHYKFANKLSFQIVAAVYDFVVSRKLQITLNNTQHTYAHTYAHTQTHTTHRLFIQAGAVTRSTREGEVRVRVRARTHARTHARTRTHTHTHTHTRARAHTHTHRRWRAYGR